MDWISHDDRFLKEHLIGLKQVTDFILEEKTQNFYSKMDLKKWVYNLVSYHDLAKASIYFQVYLANALILKGSGHKYYSIVQLKKFLEENSEKFREWKLSSQLKEHALFGAWMALSLFNKVERYGLDAFLFSKILKRHHGYLRDFTVASMNPVDKRKDLEKIGHEIDLEKYSKMLEDIGLPFQYQDIGQILDDFKIRQFDKLARELGKNKDSSFYFRTLFLYSILLSADKGDVMLVKKQFSRKILSSSLIDAFKSNTLKTDYSINKLREEAYQLAIQRTQKYGHKNFFSITLPTGLGKTFTAYKVALLIKEKYCQDFRIVYCLPFTSIIDQNASILKSILENQGINTSNIGIHHHLATPIMKDEEDSRYSEWEYFTEGWQNEITVTTFVQLWESVFANHNRQIRKFHNLANSIIILDEVQSIKPSLLPALEFMMENLARYFNTKFILVTATQPIILREKTIELCSKGTTDYFFKKMNRTIIDTNYLTEGLMNEETLARIIIDKYKKDPKSILVICNTIRFSQNLFNLVAAKLEDSEVFYLSAAIIPHSREVILEKIKSLLTERKPVILIATQVVEAGVDVDFDEVYRDFAPMFSINQAAGRGNRNSTRGTSKVYLFRSGKEKIYDPVLLDTTEKTLMEFDKSIPESQFFSLNQTFFEGVKIKIQDDSNDSNKLIKSILSLRFEDIGTNLDYRLTVEKYKSHNLYITINEEATKFWEKYLSLLDIKEHLDRKSAIKLHMPKLMKYVVKVPDYVYQPVVEDSDKALIYDENWSSFYDEIFGYKMPENESITEII